MNKRIKIISIVLVGILIAGMALYPVIKRAFTNPEEELAPPTPRQSRGALQVNAKILRYESLDEVFRARGILMPDEEVDLSFETSGKITSIHFQEGTYVNRGQLLAKVNDKPLQAELQKLEAQIQLAEDRVSRQETLLQKDAVSRESYESVATQLETLKADIALAKARIAQTELRAPFDGVIGLRQVSEGAYASPTTVISKLTKISPLKIEFSVNEGQAADIVAGTELSFQVDNDQNTYNATVYAVESRLDQNTLTLKARARYPNPGGRLRPGLSASIEINLLKHDNTLVVPSMALIQEMGRDLAYVYRNGTAHQVTVEKGLRTEAAVQITEGLNAGDTLITTGVMQLRDGMPITLSQLAAYKD